MSKYDDANKIMNERFGKDSLISIATVDGTHTSVRTVDGYYEDGAFYVVISSLRLSLTQSRRRGTVR